MDKFPDEHLRVYMYIYYMNYPNPEDNPYFHYKESEKEEEILRDIGATFSPDDDDVYFALTQYEKMCQTETSRAYNGIKTMLDKMATYMTITAITDGRDGNISQIATVAKNFDMIRQSYKGVFKDLMEEQTTSVRGGQNLAYDAQQ